MPDFTLESTTPVSPERTFDAICDLSKWPLFRGYGPLPGIVEATLPGGGVMGLGARVRVRNSDRSVHHEVVTVFERPRRYVVRMELTPPASWVLKSIEETIELEAAPGGTRMRRRFVVTRRSILTAPVAWLFGGVLLPRAVDAHNRAVAELLSTAAAQGS